jgi:hypothetical protein
MWTTAATRSRNADARRSGEREAEFERIGRRLKTAAGEFPTATKHTHRLGIALALGLRAGKRVAHTVSQSVALR